MNAFQLPCTPACTSLDLQARVVLARSNTGGGLPYAAAMAAEFATLQTQQALYKPLPQTLSLTAHLLPNDSEIVFLLNEVFCGHFSPLDAERITGQQRLEYHQCACWRLVPGPSCFCCRLAAFFSCDAGVMYLLTYTHETTAPSNSRLRVNVATNEYECSS